MSPEKLQFIKEIIQSANINFLFGSGASTPFLPLLGNIEKDINEAIENDDIDRQVDGYKVYLEKVMLPNINIACNNFTKEKNWKWSGEEAGWIENTDAIEDFQTVSHNYKSFLTTLTNIILSRKTTILNKQVNIFTTNIDIFLENTLEQLQINYNDGFSGRMNPVFSLSNFKQSTFQRSLHFDHKSEIPVFNIVKLHGSLTWKYKPDKNGILLSKDLNHISRNLLSETGTSFVDKYKENILVVNPENAKFSETVLNMYYYEMLRSYSSELEKANSVLFVIGFSMDDLHIKEITLRAAKSNPTLKIFIFVSRGKKQEKETAMQTEIHKNIEIIEPEESDRFSLDLVTKNIFQKIILNSSTDA